MNTTEARTEFRTVSDSINNMINILPEIRPRKTYGIFRESRGPIIRVTLQNARIGDLCELVDNDSRKKVLAEVVSVQEKDALLCPYGNIAGLSGKTQVIATGAPLMVPVGRKLLGQTLNAFGQPLHGDPFLPHEFEYRPVRSGTPNPVSRPLIDTVFSTGIRSIDSMTTIGQGQRIGIFGEPGAGKSVLLSMIAKHARADVCVLALIGERGREVKEFLDRQLPPEFRKNCITVVSTSDRSPMERVIGAYSATTIAEYFRDQGKSVLLLMDSVTRYARALREVGLAAGEAPARKGFPASVLSEMPQLIERTGRSETGTITALYSILVDGDSLGDPVAEELRSLTDGHIILSPELARSGHYPAIDVLASKSRIMNEISSPAHIKYANEVRQLISKYQEIELLIQVGEYQNGVDEIGDLAIEKKDLISRFMKQNTEEYSDFAQTVSRLREIAE